VIRLGLRNPRKKERKKKSSSSGDLLLRHHRGLSEEALTLLEEYVVTLA